MKTSSCGWATSSRDSRRLLPTRLPTDTYFNDHYKLSHFFNGEGVQLLHMPRANTDGDSIVYFRGSDVIALGDLMATESYPVFDSEKGGSINGIIDGLNAVLDLAITEFRLEGGTMMVPGHGRIVDSGDVAYYRDMLTIIRDRVQDMVTKEMTLDEVKAARPTADYDTEYGTTPGWTSDMFIESGLQESRRRADPAATARTSGQAAMSDPCARWGGLALETSRAPRTGPGLLVLMFCLAATPIVAQRGEALTPRAGRADRSHRILGLPRD